MEKDMTISFLATILGRLPTEEETERCLNLVNECTNETEKIRKSYKNQKYKGEALKGIIQVWVDSSARVLEIKMEKGMSELLTEEAMLKNIALATNEAIHLSIDSLKKNELKILELQSKIGEEIILEFTSSSTNVNKLSLN